MSAFATFPCAIAFSAARALNETIVTELSESPKWRRGTLDGGRSFTIMYPRFFVAGAWARSVASTGLALTSVKLSCQALFTCPTWPSSSLARMLWVFADVLVSSIRARPSGEVLSSARLASSLLLRLVLVFVVFLPGERSP